MNVLESIQAWVVRWRGGETAPRVSGLAFARLRPQQVLFEAKFWLERERTLVVLLGLTAFTSLAAVALGVTPLTGLGSLITFDFKDPDATSFLVQSAILLAGLRGLWIAAEAIAHAAVEQGQAESIADRSAALVRSVESGDAPPPTLDVLETLRPDNPTQNLIAARLFRTLQRDGREGSLPVLEELLGFYRDETDAELDRVRVLQRAALQLGILGTFVGLAFGMAHLQQLGSDAEYDAAVLGSFFSSLKASFSTSIAGLLMSLLLGRAIAHVESRQQVLFQCLEEGAGGLSVVSQLATHRLLTEQTFGQLNAGMSELAVQVREQTAYTVEQTGAIREGLGSLRTSREELEGFLDGVAEIRGKVLEEVGAVRRGLAPEAIVQGVAEGLADISDTIARRVEQGLATGLAAWEESARDARLTSELLGSTHDALQEVIASMRSQRDATELQLNESVEAQRALMEQVTQMLGVHSESFGGLMRETAKASMKASDTLEETARTMAGKESRVAESLDELSECTIELRDGMARLGGALGSRPSRWGWLFPRRRHAASGGVADGAAREEADAEAGGARVLE
ncbi:MAG: methyl-accepting chemotaxis protein [bacterium]|nr:methyl-accepting chemotaxis protein [bacterium]